MKASKAATLDTTRQPQADGILISNLENLIQRLFAGEAALGKNVKAAHENYTFCEQFCRERRVPFKSGISAHALLDRARVRIFTEDADTLQQAINALTEASRSVEKIGQEVDQVRAELREIIIREAATRNTRILENYERVIQDIIKKILPFCDDEEEAHGVARGLNAPSRLHASLFIFRGASDDMLGSYHFIQAVKFVEEHLTRVISAKRA